MFSYGLERETRYLSSSDEVETVIHSDNDFATVAYLRIKKASLQANNLDYLHAVSTPPLLEDEFASAERLITTFRDEKQVVENCDKTPAVASVNMHKSYGKAGKWVALSNIQKSDDLHCISVADEVNACFASLGGMCLLQGASHYRSRFPLSQSFWLDAVFL